MVLIKPVTQTLAMSLYSNISQPPLKLSQPPLQLAVPVESMTLNMLDAAEYPDAVCNDGSRAGYYFKQFSSLESSNTWVIFLEGGSWCVDREDCTVRCKGGGKVNDTRCSSNAWPQEFWTTAGVLVQKDVKQLRFANKVYVRHCSSDAFMGNARAYGMEFRGSKIVEAVFKDLHRTKGLGQVANLVKPDGKFMVMFGGESAGARGAMVNMDYVPEFLGKTASERLNLVAFLDSALWIDIAPLEGSGFEGFRRTCRRVADFMNITRFGSCAEHFPPMQRFKCIMGEYRIMHFKNSLFMLESAFDAFQLYNNIGHDPIDEREYEYALQFKEKMFKWVRGAIGELYTQEGIPEIKVPLKSIFIPACYTHARSVTIHGVTNDTAMDQRVGDTLVQFVDKWFNNEDGWTNDLQDWCVGFACGAKHCPDLDPLTLAEIPETETETESVAPGRASQRRSWAAVAMAFGVALAPW